MRQRDIREITSLKPGDHFRVIYRGCSGLYVGEDTFRFGRINNIGRIIAWPAVCRGIGGQSSLFHETTRVVRLTQREVIEMERLEAR